MKQDDIGYNLNERGEGCFSIIANQLSTIDKVYAEIDSQRKVSSEVRLTLTDLWSYTLVLPEMIEDNPFSKKVYESVRTVLTKDFHNNVDSGFDQKPVQFYIR